jgi:CelD/BcsL family acetyltransferase involved in cellulose biosynthesis
MIELAPAPASPRARDDDPTAPEVQVVTDPAGLYALEPEWGQLVEASGIAHPFVSHEWVRTWWECFGAGRQLQLVVARRHGVCVGIAPFLLTETRMYGLRVRRLELAANVHTPRTDILCAAPSAPVYRALWRHLYDARASWDVLMMPQLDEDSPTLSSAAQQHEVRVGTWAGPASPVLDTSGSYPDYLAGLAPKHRANLRNRERRLARLGAVRIETVRGGPALAEAVEDGLRLEAAAWKGQNGTAIVSSPDVRRFYRRLAEVAAARGWLELWFLGVDGRRMAFCYCLCYRGVRFLLKQGYDPQHAALSPGTQLCHVLIRDCFERGIRALDFLGRDEPWKLALATRSRGHSWLIGFAPSVRARLVHAIKFGLLPTLRASPLAGWLRPPSDASDGAPPRGP